MDEKLTVSSEAQVKKNVKCNKVISVIMGEKFERIIKLSPLVFIVALLPLIVGYHSYEVDFSRYDWFPNQESTQDLYLYCKQLCFNIICIYMIVILLFLRFIKKRKLIFNKVLIPLVVYVVFIVLSTIFCEHKQYTFGGIMEQFENVWCVLGYCLVIYYCYYIIDGFRDIKVIFYGLIAGSMGMVVVVLSQMFRCDILKSDFIESIILPDGVTSIGGVSETVAATLYNPNYVGIYFSTLIAIVTGWLVRFKERRIMLIVMDILYVISLIGCHSKAGFIAVFISLVFITILNRSVVKEYLHIVIPCAAGLLAVILIGDAIRGGGIVAGFKKNLFAVNSTKYKLTKIETLDDCVKIHYDDSFFKVSYDYDENKGMNIKFLDDKDNNIPYKIYQLDDAFNSSYIVMDNKKFDDILIKPTTYKEIVAVSLTIEKFEWFFTKNDEDNSYYYINKYAKLDKIEESSKAVFTNFPRIFSGRGYIWAATIPLLKDKILIGSGIDTYLLEFAQDDYVKLQQTGYSGLLMTKPHSLYLQIGVQSGVMSLIAFIVFFVIYLIQGGKIYLSNGDEKCSDEVKYIRNAGFAIYLVVVNFLIMGITNDSSITTSPMCFTIIGVGFACNMMLLNKKTVQ